MAPHRLVLLAPIVSRYIENGLAYFSHEELYTTLAQLPRLNVNPLTIWFCCRQLSAVALKDYLGSQKYERMIPSWNWDFRFNSETFSGSTKIAHSMPLLFVLVVKVFLDWASFERAFFGLRNRFLAIDQMLSHLGTIFR